MAAITVYPGQVAGVRVAFTVKAASAGGGAIGDTWWRAGLIKGVASPTNQPQEGAWIKTGDKGPLYPGDTRTVTCPFKDGIIPGDWGNSLISVYLDMEMWDASGKTAEYHPLKLWPDYFVTLPPTKDWLTITEITPITG